MEVDQGENDNSVNVILSFSVWSKRSSFRIMKGCSSLFVVCKKTTGMPISAALHYGVGNVAWMVTLAHKKDRFRRMRTRTRTWRIKHLWIYKQQNVSTARIIETRAYFQSGNIVVTMYRSSSNHQTALKSRSTSPSLRRPKLNTVSFYMPLQLIN